jgi:long-chain acyl-CoA synthetase
VPYQFAALASLPEDSPADLSGLKWCISSGDVLPQQTYQRFLARFGLPIRSLYGSTEAGSICINTDPAEMMQFGSLGLALKNVALQIRDEAGQELPNSHSGQIWVKSPVMPPTGYDNRPELNAQAFRAGYYNTGDIGQKDARGHLVITGRKQTFVDVGGYKVDIGEVEEVLQSHPQVREAAALGVEVPNLGELIKAVVVTHGPCQEADLLAYCRERLAAFKIPRLVEFRAALPRSPIGKVLKKELADVTAYLSSLGGGAPAAELVLPAQQVLQFQQAFQAASEHARGQQAGLLAAYIQEQVAATLQREVELIPRSASFQSLGFVSLRAA